MFVKMETTQGSVGMDESVPFGCQEGDGFFCLSGQEWLKPFCLMILRTVLFLLECCSCTITRMAAFAELAGL